MAVSAFDQDWFFYCGDTMLNIVHEETHGSGGFARTSVADGSVWYRIIGYQPRLNRINCRLAEHCPGGMS
jgi:hypothetical protein